MLFKTCVVYFHLLSFFFFNDTATTEIYTLSLHDALPISAAACNLFPPTARFPPCPTGGIFTRPVTRRSEEHTSELQSHSDLVCRLLLEKKKKEHQASKENNRKQPQTTTMSTSKPNTSNKK